MQWALNLTSHWHVRRCSLRLDLDFEGCCFSWLAYCLQTCCVLVRILAPWFPSPKWWLVVKKGWKLNGLVLSISHIYLTFASFHGTVKIMQLTSSVGARKTCAESTQPKDAPTCKRRHDKPCKPSSRPSLYVGRHPSQSSSDFQRNSGPSNHSWQLNNASDVYALKGQSPGLATPST